MTAIDIRDASSPDVEAVARLWYEGWHDAHGGLFEADFVAARTVEHFRQRTERPFDRVLVACDGERIAGFAALAGREVDQLYVDRAVRGGGVGTRLLAAGEAVLRSAGVEVVLIQCLVGNEPAAAFYRRRGYRDAGIADLPLWAAPGEGERLHPTHRFEKVLAATK